MWIPNKKKDWDLILPDYHKFPEGERALCSNISEFLHELSIIIIQKDFVILLVGSQLFTQMCNHNMFVSISVSPSLSSAEYVGIFPALLELCAVPWRGCCPSVEQNWCLPLLSLHVQWEVYKMPSLPPFFISPFPMVGQRKETYCIVSQAHAPFTELLQFMAGSRI